MNANVERMYEGKREREREVANQERRRGRRWRRKWFIMPGSGGGAGASRLTPPSAWPCAVTKAFALVGDRVK